MNRANRGSCVVLDTTGKLAGIFTERDFVAKIVDAKRDPETTAVSEVMTPADVVQTVPPTMTIADCRRLIIKENRRRVPVVAEDGTVMGVVTSRDLVRVLQESILEKEAARLYGSSIAEISQQSKELSNTLALERGQKGSQQDLLRSLFVLGFASLAAAAYTQGKWVHDHEVLSMVFTFALGYVGIVFETFLEFNKAAIALLMAVALWTIFAGTGGASGVAVDTALVDLSEKVGEVSEVVFFLLGAMTIVEVVDSHQGFKVVTDNIKAKDKRGLMWVVGFITFFMSAILDNLTTTIVMVSLTKKLLSNAEDRKLFGAMIVIAANAGGAWTPIGDVTTTMLWINGQISAIPTMTSLLLPSIASVVLSIAMLQNQIPEGEKVEDDENATRSDIAPRGKIVFAAGLAGLLSVPVFKALTGLPPYLGMLASLGVMWTLTDAIHAGEGREELQTTAALRKIDTSGVLFFLGILLSVGALDSAGILRSLAEFLDSNLPSQEIIATVIGIASALIDNVPLVAATMGMYPVSQQPMDSNLWQLIAFCAGTGGSLLVIGSAAGVALMGIEKVDFMWYAKKITASAAVGYFGGIAVYLAQNSFSSGAGFEGLSLPTLLSLGGL
jgi:Na+/H+ antiporter NhaD/arsenite permease-like protein